MVKYAYHLINIFLRILMEDISKRQIIEAVSSKILINKQIILRKTIEGYFDSVPSLTFNTIKT